MWYEGVAQDGSRSIGVAVSSNGISGWKPKNGQVLVLKLHTAELMLMLDQYL